jgi:hypothetical protein
MIMETKNCLINRDSIGASFSLMPIAFFPKIGYGKYILSIEYHALKGKFKNKNNSQSNPPEGVENSMPAPRPERTGVVSTP